MSLEKRVQWFWLLLKIKSHTYFSKQSAQARFVRHHYFIICWFAYSVVVRLFVFIFACLFCLRVIVVINIGFSVYPMSELRIQWLKGFVRHCRRLHRKLSNYIWIDVLFGKMMPKHNFTQIQQRTHSPIRFVFIRSGLCGVFACCCRAVCPRCVFFHSKYKIDNKIF